MTTCPKVLQCSAVLKVVNPVTQVADVAVKRASKKFVASPDCDDIGNDHIIPPNKIKPINPNANI